jgi:type VI protein secretion system component VasF
LRLSRVLRPAGPSTADERIPLRRILFWVAVWVGILVGIVFYFRYARLLTPLLG